MKRQAHPSEDIIGRITNSGSWDRRYRAFTPPEPFKADPWRTAVEIALSVPLILILVIGIPFLAWLVAGAVQ